MASKRTSRSSRGSRPGDGFTKAQEDVMDAFAKRRRPVLSGPGPEVFRDATLQALERRGYVRRVKRKPAWELPSTWQANVEEGFTMWTLLPGFRELAEDIRSRRLAATRRWR